MLGIERRSAFDDFGNKRAWTAAREDELAATAMGIPANRLKLSALAVGASFAGARGVLFAASRTFVSPESFTFLVSVNVLTMVILGGIGSIPGVIVGAVVVTILNLQILQSLSLWLAQLRQSEAFVPIINFHWKDLSNQLDPSKYQRLVLRDHARVDDDLPAGGHPACRKKKARAQGRRRR